MITDVHVFFLQYVPTCHMLRRILMDHSIEDVLHEMLWENDDDKDSYSTIVSVQQK
jgi:hypothetical protein